MRARGEAIRRFILERVQKSPSDVAKDVAAKFGITRQAANKHLRRMESEGILKKTGKTAASAYSLAALAIWDRKYAIAPGLAEDVVWRNDVRPVLAGLPDNVLNIWHYGFTEMFNNAIDHSGGSTILVMVHRTATATEMFVSDDGLGIFKKIQAAANLLDERHAILELAKGKLTTDPKRHTGEGIFFTSRMMDSYRILSGGVSFAHDVDKPEDWILEFAGPSGTLVWMRLDNNTSRTAKKIFDKFSSGDDYGFTKTVIPVRLAQYGEDQLISRSQARRLLARVELFRSVVLDFTDVALIGQAFADEIFRVFANEHSAIELTTIRANSEVKRMIARVRSAVG